MFDRIIRWCLENRFLVVVAIVLLVGWGIFALRDTPIDAIPDIGVNQQVVFVDWPGRSPQDIEDQVVYPLTVNLMGIPGVLDIRSTSAFSFGLINVIFEDDIDFYWSRTRILERLNTAQKDIPSEVVPELGPDATALGQVFWYTVENGFYCPKHPHGYLEDQKTGERYDDPAQAPDPRRLERVYFDEPGVCPLDGEPLSHSSLDLGELRSLQDWYVRYQLTSAGGVSEVGSVGGYVKQYQIDVEPVKLLAHDVSLAHVFNAVKLSNIDVGAKVVEENSREFIVRGLGFIRSTKDIEDIVVSSPNGRPVFVRDVGTVTLGPDFRRGGLDKNGVPAVGGVVLMRYGENPLQVIENVKVKIREIEAGLPAGVRIVPFLDRTELINRATETLVETLKEEIAVAVAVIVVFLASITSSLIVSAVLPTGVLLAVLAMYYLGIPSNIMSLGGIAISIGVMVDAGIVMTENIYRHLALARREGSHAGGKERLEIILKAASEVAPPIFFSMLIIIVAFIPVFSLTGQAGKLFHPLAFTKTFAMGGAIILALTLIPVLCSFLIRSSKDGKEENLLTRWLRRGYAPVLQWALRNRWTIMVIAFVIVTATLPFLWTISSEFMPPLNEGDLLFMPILLPGASLTQVKEVLSKQDRILNAFPEVEMAVGKLGRAESATDPAPVAMIETIVKLKPAHEWRAGMTREQLIREMDQALKIPGVSNIWTQPIRNRIDMLSTGIQTPVGAKVFGSDLKIVEELAIEVERVLQGVPGAVSPYAERIGNKPYIEIEMDREEAARYGIHVGEVQDLIMTAIGGMNLTTTVEGRERYPVRVRYKRELRDSLDDIKRVMMPNQWMWRNPPIRTQVPLGEIADIRKTLGPTAIKSENTLLYARVFVDVDTEQMGLIDFVNRAQTAVEAELDFPSGYYVEWSGQYEAEMESRRRLLIVVPVCIAVIFLLLYLNFRSPLAAVIVMLGVLFAFVGGIWLQLALGFKFSTAVWVGYIALFGVAVESGVVLVDYIRTLEKKGYATIDAILRAGLLRVRPILMTTATTIIALLPILFKTGAGSEIMQPIAAPTIGGMVTATLANLFLVPVLYATLSRSGRRRHGVS